LTKPHWLFFIVSSLTLQKKKHKASRGRKQNRRAKQTATQVLPKKSKSKSKLLPPKNGLATFLLKTNARCLKTGGIFNVKEQLFTESHGKLYCLACQKAISWNNRYCHSTTSVHVDKKVKYLKALDDPKMGEKICQVRISAEALTGINYEEGQNGNTFMWV
jgi:hypothetical protein